MKGNIYNSNGIHVGVVIGPAIFDLSGKKLYGLKGINIYRLSGELVGHLNSESGSERRLDKATDRLFSRPKSAEHSSSGPHDSETECLRRIAEIDPPPARKK